MYELWFHLFLFLFCYHEWNVCRTAEYWLNVRPVFVQNYLLSDMLPVGQGIVRWSAFPNLAQVINCARQQHEQECCVCPINYFVSLVVMMTENNKPINSTSNLDGRAVHSVVVRWKLPGRPAQREFNGHIRNTKIPLQLPRYAKWFWLQVARGKADLYSFLVDSILELGGFSVHVLGEAHMTKKKKKK